MNITFEDKIVLVNGGSRGIGQQIVKDFIASGAYVYFTYRASHDVVKDFVQSMNSDRLIPHCLDNEDPVAISSFVQDIGNKHKQIDVLVNNAGLVVRDLIATMSLDNWQSAFKINATAPFLYAKAAVRYMRKAASPSIVNISSVTSDRASRGLAAYCASKSALEALTKVLSMELASYPIRVNSVAPGFIETDIAQATADEVRQKILARTPLGRLGTPAEVSNAVLFLASPYASYITGTQLYVTGGRHLE